MENMPIRIGSMQSNDLLIEHDARRECFELVNTLTAVPDDMVSEYLSRVLQQGGLDIQRMRIYYCGANEWVVRARGKALSAVLNGEACGDGK